MIDPASLERAAELRALLASGALATVGRIDTLHGLSSAAGGGTR